MEQSRVVLVAQNDHFKVRVLEGGVLSERQFRVKAFAVSWAEGQSLRLGVPLGYEAMPAMSGLDPAPGLAPHI